MTIPEKEKPLPKPPASPFGAKKRFEQREDEIPLLADRLAAAAAEGRLEELMKEELPDSEHARDLVMMMMGMTGMMPPEGLGPETVKEPGEHAEGAGERESPEETPSGVQPPEDISKAVQSGDVAGLKGLLEREHKKRTPESRVAREDEKETEQFPVLSTVEKEIVDGLMKIASKNGLSMDWIVLRALKLYVQEYQRTGRL